ncbi:MAG: aconitase X catalytic domain-containing protein [Lachnospiraceae bacterium]
MELTAEEQKMLDGSRGKGNRLAMEILVKMGELYGAQRFLPVKNAHIDAAAYTTIWDAGIEFLELLAEQGAAFAVPTTINPLSRDIQQWEELGTSSEFAAKSKRIEDTYLRMGVLPTWTCAPYQCTNVPGFKEVVSWSESNAVNYVNSVIGARAERLPDLVDVCCAVTGRVPEYGLYLDKNRRGDSLFLLEGFDDTWFTDSVDYAVLGYYVGEIAVNKVPVIEGLPSRTGPDNLKAFSAASASGGAVALFHAVGFTPEAKTREEAFLGKTDYKTYLVTPKELCDMEQRLNTAVTNKVDLVLMGCPHSSVIEMTEVAEQIKGKHVMDGTSFWIMTNETQYNLALRKGTVKILTDAGVVITRDTCMMEMDEGIGRWKGQTVVTNSGKVAQYAPGINQVHIRMASTKNSVEAAVTGQFTKEERHGYHGL